MQQFSSELFSTLFIKENEQLHMYLDTWKSILTVEHVESNIYDIELLTIWCLNHITFYGLNPFNETNYLFIIN
jgi:hypothetical protein